jgi:hypothetical protein
MQIIILMHEFLNAYLTITYIKIDQNLHIGLISYCKNNIKCDSASNSPKCPLNNGVYIVQKHVVTFSTTSTMSRNKLK